jgi:hypothetical protein
VKPSNILLAHDGRILLTDFGIAAHSSDPTLTHGGDAGTPAYMAPERLSGGRATLAADLFALGATLYYAAEGIAPFERDTVPASITAVLHVDPVPAHSAPSLFPAIGGLLVKDPARRLQADGAGALLARALDDDRPRETSGGAGGGSARGPADRRSQNGRVGMPVPGSVGGDAAPVPRLGGGGGVPAWPDTGRRLPRPRVPRRLPFPRGPVVLAAGALLFLGALVGVLAWAFDGSTAASRSPGGSGPGRLPPAMVGSWVGNVTQGDVVFEAKLAIRGGDVGGVIGFSTYPAEGCAADLTLVEVAGPAVTVQETLTRTTGLCRGADRLLLTLRADGTLDYYFGASLINDAGQGILARK